MDIEQKINELKDALRSIMNMIVKRGQPLNSELKSLFQQVMQHVASRIDEMRSQGENAEQEVPQNNQPSQPLQEAMPSSNIDSFAYDDKTGKLMVRFLGDYPNRQGSLYSYEGVPKQIFDLFKKGAIPARTNGSNEWGNWWRGKVPSMGASMYTLIKNGGYNYQKVA